MKTNELTGAALNWAVAKCEPDDTLAIYFDEGTGEPLCRDDWEDNQEYKPSTDWSQGGPIIERESIRVTPDQGETYVNCVWFAGSANGDGDEFNGEGPTPLIAAMRCFVASKLGDEIDVPKELT